jgi:hypothetical protein
MVLVCLFGVIEAIKAQIKLQLSLSNKTFGIYPLNLGGLLVNKISQ